MDLRIISMFENLAPDALDRIEKQCSLRTFEKDAEIFGEQENTTAPPGGALKPRGPYSGKLTSPPSNSSFRFTETAKRRCAVPAVVLSRTSCR